MTIDLDAIEKLAAAASPAPWEPFSYAPQKELSFVGIEAGDRSVFSNDATCYAQGWADVAFCCAAREALPALVAEVRRLRRQAGEDRDHDVVHLDAKTYRAIVEQRDGWHRDAEAAEGRVRELEAALKRHGRHTENCCYPMLHADASISYAPCVCGLDAALAGSETT